MYNHYESIAKYWCENPPASLADALEWGGYSRNSEDSKYKLKKEIFKIMSRDKYKLEVNRRRGEKRRKDKKRKPRKKQKVKIAEGHCVRCTIGRRVPFKGKYCLDCYQRHILRDPKDVLAIKKAASIVDDVNILW